MSSGSLFPLHIIQIRVFPSTIYLETEIKYDPIIFYLVRERKLLIPILIIIILLILITITVYGKAAKLWNILLAGIYWQG